MNNLTNSNSITTRNGIKELVTYHLEDSELTEFKKSVALLKKVNQEMMKSLSD